MAMENKKQLLLIVFAVIVGIVAVVMASSVMTSKLEQQAIQMKEEYEARQKEELGKVMQRNDQNIQALAQRFSQEKEQQAQMMQKQMDDLKISVAAQQRAAAAAAAVTAAPVKKVKPSLALKTPTGKRAITVLINSLAAVGGLLNPGDMVDIIAQLNIPNGEKADLKNTVTAMVFQGVEVLAVNTNLEETGAYYDEQQNAPGLRVTVAVDPEEAGLLSFADKNGKLELALRSPQETERQMVKSSTWKTLADYVLQNQGTDIELPESLKGTGTKTEVKDGKPDIQIFRGGKEL